MCLDNLNFAFDFKLQCEYTDRKLRRALAETQHEDISKYCKEEEKGETQSVFDKGNVEDADELPLSSDEVKRIVEVNGIRFDYYMNDESEREVDDLIEVDPEVNTAENEDDQQVDYLDLNESEWNSEGSERLLDDPSEENEADKQVEMFLDLDGESSDAEEDLNEEEPTTQTHTGVVQMRLADKSLRKDGKSYKCDTCGEEFDNFVDFNGHKKAHGDRRYQCLTCQRWFSKRYHLKNHISIHSREKLFKCDMCAREYTNRGNLDRHIRVNHNNERQHVCTICGKSFSQLNILRQHYAVHSTERPFPCEICGKAFKTKEYLALHKMCHLPKSERPKRTYKSVRKKQKKPQKPCVCTECGKHSNTIALHLSHMRTHSGDRPFACSICNKKFSFQQSLKSHMYLHTGEKPYKCDICGMSFRQIGHLKGEFQRLLAFRLPRTNSGITLQVTSSSTAGRNSTHVWPAANRLLCGAI